MKEKLLNMTGENSLAGTPDSSTSQTSFLPLSKKKIGSLRENKKLFSILQQFESSSVDDLSSSSRDLSNSSKSSTNSSKLNKPHINDIFTTSNSNTSSKNEKQIVGSEPPWRTEKRHSEGEILEPKFQFDKEYKSLFKSSSVDGKLQLQDAQGMPALSSSRSYDFTNNNTYGSHQTILQPYRNVKDNYNRLKFVSVSNPISRLNEVSKTQKSISMSSNVSSNSGKDVGGMKHSPMKETVDYPPPIPRRGMSLPVSSIMDTTKYSPTKDQPSLPTLTLISPHSPKSSIKQDSVKKVIQMYEGLSSKSIKNSKFFKKSNYPKVSVKKDHSHLSGEHSKTSVLRKNSTRKGSFRRPAPSTEGTRKSNSPSTPSQSDQSFQHSKEDSGIGFSDNDDPKTQLTIYQSLCNGASKDQCGSTYDRLNRIHDIVNRIHKGQSSNCAACKATPSGQLQRSQFLSGPSILHVKCNEMAPHHHPPCICFSCQHSVFSCSQDEEIAAETLANLNLLGEQENLYYNVCCLTGHNCEGWRQSRRRPVCEQNGKLCVVNCDKERNNPENFYEHLSECSSNKIGEKIKKPLYSNSMSCDSGDSDEGWVDITDSEDEKTLSDHGSSQCLLHYQQTDQRVPSSSGSNKESDTLSIQNTCYEDGNFHSKVCHDAISRTSSAEHLYESIADIEGQSNQDEPRSDEKYSVHENDPDSGEWSTESSCSLSLGESHSSKQLLAKAKPMTSEYSAQRFLVGSDVKQDSSTKKTFIKSVLGKKTVSPKKRRMSHFFVPWLVSNNEYGLSRSPKSTLKKQSSSQTIKIETTPSKAAKTFAKSKRSQSIPSSGSDTTVPTQKLFSSSSSGVPDLFNMCEGSYRELERATDDFPKSNMGCSLDSLDVLTQRGSLASSTYLRADQVHSAHTHAKLTPNIEYSSENSSPPVSVEKVFSRSTSKESMHSYIVFQPIKEEDVPLYQFYERNIKERVSICRSPECLSPMLSVNIDAGTCSDFVGQRSPQLRPQLSVVEQLSPDAKDMKMLWCELPEVKDSGILERISAQELKLQEAAFELIQSQASFVRSLRVLYEHFISVPEFSDTQSSFCVLSKHEHDVLFSDIVGVKEVSEKLLAELTVRWSDGILIPDICDIIYGHALMPSFAVYVKYCSNRVYQEKTLKELKETRLCFLEVLRRLESNPACQGLSLDSFLYLPMQHIARLPLLIDSIFRWLNGESPSFGTCKMALEAVHKCFMQCNDGAKRMERLEEMFMLNRQIEFKECKVIPLISASRWLLKRGELTKLEFDKKTFGKSNRCVRVPLHLFLFNNLLLVTKRKSDDCYTVLDYCQQDKIQAMAVEAKDLQQPELIPNTCRYLIYLTLFSNHQGCAVDMIFNCTLLSERTRWIEAIHPVPEKKTAEVWEYDCPQVQCVRSYIAQQPDELSLQESDVVTIHRKMNDGWYEGRRLRDGLRGWFPASYTMDIPCSRARASNLRQCYRLLMLSQKHEAK